jgi:aquaporin Z
MPHFSPIDDLFSEARKDNPPGHVSADPWNLVVPARQYATGGASQKPVSGITPCRFGLPTFANPRKAGRCAMKKLFTEFAGTIALTLSVIAAACLPDRLQGCSSALAGAVLAGIVYAGYRVSGAHYNPAITLAVLYLRKISRKQAAAYMAFQLAGAWLAGLIYFKLTGQPPGISLQPAVSWAGSPWPVFLECAFTFLLTTVILWVALSPVTRGNRYYGLAIGGTVALLGFFAGPWSGGAFNPAVGLGPLLAGWLTAGSPSSHGWIYVAGPAAGALAGAWLYRRMDRH